VAYVIKTTTRSTAV